MPFYDHECRACGHIWEDFYSAAKNPPDTCPECKVQGKVQRLIPDNIAVRVPLTGHELKAKIAKERQEMKEKVKKNENLRANLAGEDRYHKSELAREELKQNLKNI